MKKIQKKARQDNKNGKELENDEEKGLKLKVKEEENSKIINYIRQSNMPVLRPGYKQLVTCFEKRCLDKSSLVLENL